MKEYQFAVFYIFIAFIAFVALLYFCPSIFINYDETNNYNYNYNNNYNFLPDGNYKNNLHDIITIGSHTSAHNNALIATTYNPKPVKINFPFNK